MSESPHRPNPFHHWIPLEQPRLGTRVVAANDEFFGAKERLIQSAPPVFIPERYDEHGKWMDGWETRRRREPGHDWCIVRLGMDSVVHGLDIDTSHFTGNYPPEASVDGCRCDAEVPPGDAAWNTVCDRISLRGDSHHYVTVDGAGPFSHLRLNIFPDGGVARLRVYGEAAPAADCFADGEIVDLLAVENGGRALACSDEHFGSMHNLNLPGRGVNMGDGWETARRRGPGHDWVVLVLGHPGTVTEIEIDTAHFKGNYPARAALLGARPDRVDLATLGESSDGWTPLLPEVPLEADTRHLFRDLDPTAAPVSHVRLNIFPDGGVSRLRVRGKPAEART